MAVRCIECGASAAEARVGVDVDTGLVHCSACDTEFGPDEIREHVAGWERLLAWVEAYPRQAGGTTGGKLKAV